METPEGMLTYPTAADRIGVTRERFNDLIHYGEIAFTQVGHRRFIAESDVEKYLEPVPDGYMDGAQASVLIFGTTARRDFATALEKYAALIRDGVIETVDIDGRRLVTRSAVIAATERQRQAVAS